MSKLMKREWKYIIVVNLKMGKNVLYQMYIVKLLFRVILYFINNKTYCIFPV